MMVWIHGVLSNWRLAIIVFTTLVKLLLWPLTKFDSRKITIIKEYIIINLQKIIDDIKVKSI